MENGSATLAPYGRLALAHHSRLERFPARATCVAGRAFSIVTASLATSASSSRAVRMDPGGRGRDFTAGWCAASTPRTGSFASPPGSWRSDVQRVTPKYRDRRGEEPVVEAVTDIWLGSGRYIQRGQRVPISDPIVRKEFMLSQHPARPVQTRGGRWKWRVNALPIPLVRVSTR